MAEIEIHFTEYFDGDVVKISRGSQELHSSEPLKTDVRIGLANIVKVGVPDGRSTLTIELLSKKASTSVTIDADQVQFVRVKLSGGKLEAAAVSKADYQREPRGYM